MQNVIKDLGKGENSKTTAMFNDIIKLKIVQKVNCSKSSYFSK